MGGQTDRQENPDRRLEWAKVAATVADALSRLLEVFLRR